MRATNNQILLMSGKDPNMIATAPLMVGERPFLDDVALGLGACAVWCSENSVDLAGYEATLRLV